MDGDVPQEEGELPLRFYDRERNAYKDSLTPVNPDQVAMEEVNHREYLRKVGRGWGWVVLAAYRRNRLC